MINIDAFAPPPDGQIKFYFNRLHKRACAFNIMELKSPDIDITDLSVSNYIHGSKSTDFIKPQESIENLEAQQSGESHI